MAIRFKRRSTCLRPPASFIKEIADRDEKHCLAAIQEGDLIAWSNISLTLLFYCFSDSVRYAMTQISRSKDVSRGVTDAVASATSQTISKAVADALREHQDQQSCRTSGAFGAAKQAMSEIISEERQAIEHIAVSQLQPTESLVACEKAEQRAPLLVRLLPFVPDVFKRSKRFVIAVTTHRVVVIQLHSSLVLNRFKSFNVVFSRAKGQIHSIENVKGVFSSVILIRDRNGSSTRYTDLHHIAADRLSSALQ